MIDGLDVAGQMITVALIICADGTKVPVGLVFGERVVIQRSTLHKRRIVIGYLPVDDRDAIDRRLAIAFAQPDPTKGLKACRDLARQLEAKHPDAAASLRGGLEQMFTVAGLGVTGRLRQSLTNTNCIESMISITRTTTHRVKHWQDGTMKRWIAAGMLEAERSSAASRATPTCPHSSPPSPARPHPPLPHPPPRSSRLSKAGITTALQQQAGHHSCNL